MPVIPFWLKIVGPLALLAVLLGAWQLDRRGQYNKGHGAGVAETDAKWLEAAERAKAEAAKSATKADDKAIVRVEVQAEKVAKEQEKLDEAARTGSSPLDILFGGR